MLTKKQQLFLNLIIDCYRKNKELPTISILKQNSTYKSYNTIHKYLTQLEKKGFIKYDTQKKKVIYIKKYVNTEIVSHIPIINDNNYLTVSTTFLKVNKEYVAFKLHNNKLNSYYLKKNDILIIEKSLTNLNNKLILVLIDNKYYILKYLKTDGIIQLINDKDSFILNSFDIIIGKVYSCIRMEY